MTYRVTATITRGAKKGVPLVPHRHADGKYVVSESRFKDDYIYLGSIDEVVEHVRAGYKLRMSPADGSAAASLISPGSIDIIGSVS